MSQVAYGVFRLGQIWSVVGDDGTKLGFLSRAVAVDAAHTIVSAHRACGLDAEILVQDELGLLTTVRPVRG